MGEQIRELVILALLSAVLCGVAVIHQDVFAAAAFAALVSGIVVITDGLGRRF